jgi:predicted RNA-binding protein with PUA-like domain
MPTQHFLIKSEPDVYAFADLIRDGRALWDGVRNYEARNNLRAMRCGDRLLYYHSNIGKEVVGIAEVVKTAYPDPTLSAIRKEPKLKDMNLLRKGRISVVPVTRAEFTQVLKMGGTKLPK